MNTDWKPATYYENGRLSDEFLAYIVAELFEPCCELCFSTTAKFLYRYDGEVLCEACLLDVTNETTEGDGGA